MLIRTLLIAVALMGCSDPYGDAQKVDTIAGWEAFVKDNPKNPKRSLAEVRLEELYLKAARDGKSLEGYDTYLQKFPKGQMAAAATKEREAKGLRDKLKLTKDREAAAKPTLSERRRCSVWMVARCWSSCGARRVHAGHWHHRAPRQPLHQRPCLSWANRRHRGANGSALSTTRSTRSATTGVL